jgi:hypothetical protein
MNTKHVDDRKERRELKRKARKARPAKAARPSDVPRGSLKRKIVHQVRGQRRR